MSDIFIASTTLSLIQTIKNSWNFEKQNRLTILTPGSKRFSLEKSLQSSRTPYYTLIDFWLNFQDWRLLILTTISRVEAYPNVDAY